MPCSFKSWRRLGVNPPCSPPVRPGAPRLPRGVPSAWPGRTPLALLPVRLPRTPPAPLASPRPRPHSCLTQPDPGPLALGGPPTPEGPGEGEQVQPRRPHPGVSPGWGLKPGRAHGGLQRSKAAGPGPVPVPLPSLAWGLPRTRAASSHTPRPPAPASLQGRLRCPAPAPQSSGECAPMPLTLGRGSALHGAPGRSFHA